MPRRSIKTVSYRRKREGKTNYKDRLKHLLSRKPRLVLRKSQKNITVQLVDYQPDGDVTKVKVSSKSLSKYGWNYSKNNIPACYLAGLLAGKIASSNNFKEAVADLGMQSKKHGGKLYAALKGAVDAGMDIPHSEDCFPSEERLKGEHIKNFAPEEGNQFASYKKNNIDTSSISQVFEDTKKKILES